MTDGAVGSLLVVDRDPLLADGTSLIETVEQIGIKDLETERAVEAFDVRVLCRAAGLRELPFDPVGRGPRLHDVAAKLWTIVTAHGVGLPYHSHNCCNTRTTRSPVRLKSMSMARTSRAQSSMTLKVR